VLPRDHTVLPALHPLVYSRTKCTIPAFAFPAEAGPYLPNLEGLKAELAYLTKNRKPPTDLLAAMFSRGQKTKAKK